MLSAQRWHLTKVQLELGLGRLQFVLLLPKYDAYSRQASLLQS